ncbi:hypothetical protein DSO57_1016252 [Entomophthora muscae]|nr:hypothetical protein DSO57_1016252 [Entomophthora muscae]
MMFDLATKTLHRLRVGNFLLEIKHNILLQKKFHYFSGHDLTVSALLSALGIRKTR